MENTGLAQFSSKCINWGVYWRCFLCLKYLCYGQQVGVVFERPQPCGQISKEESESLRRSCSARTPAGIMETRHGKASAPSAGESESERVQLEPSDRTQGEHTADNGHTDSLEHLDLNIFVSCNVTDMTSRWKQKNDRNLFTIVDYLDRHWRTHLYGCFVKVTVLWLSAWGNLSAFGFNRVLFGCLMLSFLAGRATMELLSPSPNSRRRKTRRKVVGLTQWGDSSGEVHRLQNNKVAMLSVVSYIVYKSKNFDLLTCSVVGICPKLM